MIDEGSQSNDPFRESLIWKFGGFTSRREHADESPTGKLLESLIESVEGFSSESFTRNNVLDILALVEDEGHHAHSIRTDVAE